MIRTAYIALFLVFISGCGKDKLPVIKDISEKEYTLVNQNNKEVNFPQDYKGQMVVMGFIFTHCPDICPMTTHNMERIEERLNKEGIRDVRFVAFSFDPERDRPDVLTEYAGVRDINLSKWSFLTGDGSAIDSLKGSMGVVAIAGDTTVDASGEKSYFFIHTDRISLIDKDGKLRKNYSGSQINVDEIVNDIKLLED